MRREELIEGGSVLLGWCLTYALFYAANEWGVWGWIVWFGVVGSLLSTSLYVVKWGR